MSTSIKKAKAAIIQPMHDKLITRRRETPLSHKADSHFVVSGRCGCSFGAETNEEQSDWADWVGTLGSAVEQVHGREAGSSFITSGSAVALDMWAGKPTLFTVMSISQPLGLGFIVQTYDAIGDELVLDEAQINVPPTNPALRAVIDMLMMGNGVIELRWGK